MSDVTTDLIERSSLCETIINLRDFGGYATEDGRRVVRGRLFRCGHMAEVSDADLALLGDLGIGLVLDLRTGEERRLKPSRRPAGFAGRLIESIAGDLGPPPHLDVGVAMTEEAARARIARHYRKFPTKDWLRDALTRYFAALAEEDRGVIVHCTAGKDRTGISVALTHALLGVPRETIVADYLLTQRAHHLLLQSEGARIMRSRYGEVSETALGVMMGVEPPFLLSALEGIEADHGSIDAYLADVLGVTDAMRTQIRARFTEAE